MSTKPKSFWRFYAVIALILAGAAALPLRNFFIMLSIISRGFVFELPRLFSVSSVIPFMAVLSAILVGFLLLPALWKMPTTKRRALACACAVIIFAGLGLCAEAASVRLDSINIRSAMLARHRPHPVFTDDAPALFWSAAPRELLEAHGFIPEEGRYGVWIAPEEIPPEFVVHYSPHRIPSAFTSRAPRELLEAQGFIQVPGGFAMWVAPDNVPYEYLIPVTAFPSVIDPAMITRAMPSLRFDVTSMYIPWHVRLHYYIFSVVLILAVLNFLYSLANLLYGDGKPGKRVATLHGIATGCYALAYFFVRVMQYEDHAMLLLTWGSVLNAAICFILAAIAVGLYCGSFMRDEGRRKIIPPISSAITVLALYVAQYAMLGGSFYLYSESAAVNIFLRILIVVIPGIAVYFLLRKCEEIGMA